MNKGSTSHKQFNLYTTLDIKDKEVEHFIQINIKFSFKSRVINIEIYINFIHQNTDFFSKLV